MALTLLIRFGKGVFGNASFELGRLRPLMIRLAFVRVVRAIRKFGLHRVVQREFVARSPTRGGRELLLQQERVERRQHSLEAQLPRNHFCLSSRLTPKFADQIVRHQRHPQPQGKVVAGLPSFIGHWEDAKSGIAHDDAFLGQLEDQIADECSLGDGVGAVHGPDHGEHGGTTLEFERHDQERDWKSPFALLIGGQRILFSQSGDRGERHGGAVEKVDPSVQQRGNGDVDEMSSTSLSATFGRPE